MSSDVDQLQWWPERDDSPMDSDVDQWREDQEPQEEEEPNYEDEPEWDYEDELPIPITARERERRFNEAMGEFLDTRAGDEN